jgi:CheY-like chemotaxis protein
MKKIVVAESSPTIKSVADNLLRQNGYEVVCTSDGLQAWEVINSEKPDLVLTGLNISGINGLELCRQVSSDSKIGEIPVAMMVGAKDNVSEDELISTGASGKLNKPFSPRDLLVIVRELIGEGETVDQPDEPSSGEKPKTANNKAEVLTTARHLGKSGEEVYNLDWTDLNDSSVTDSGISEDVNAGEDDFDDDQEIKIIDDQFDLAALNQVEEETESKRQPSDDEDYDWFVGEMQKDVSNESEGAKSKEKVGKDKKISPPKSSADKLQPVEEEIKSSNTRVFGRDNKKVERKASRQNSDPIGSDSESRTVTEAEITKIAEKVTQNLASAIAANIDNKKIIDAIKSVLKH